MKKTMNRVFAATCLRGFIILAATVIVLTSCSNNDNDSNFDNLSEKLIGKWLTTEHNGLPCITNMKVAHTFVKEGSGLKMYNSLSMFESNWWSFREEMDVTIDGNKLVAKDAQGIVVTYMEVTSISENRLEFITSTTWTEGDSTASVGPRLESFVRVNADYSSTILGTWEGRSTGQDGSEFDDGENHRWEYRSDGTFTYYEKINDQWQAKDDEFAHYFIDGNLLCTRWKNSGQDQEEHREWWEIVSIENNVMKWTALRFRNDGSSYTATFQMERISE